METSTPHSPNASASVAAAPPIEVEVFERYLQGFPMVVAITVYNPSTTRTFGNLPKVNFFSAPGPVEFTFVEEDSGQRFRMPYSRGAGLEPGQGKGFWLAPGERRKMLFDLSELEVLPAPGLYRLEARYHRLRGFSEAEPVSIEIVAASPADSSIATLLKNTNDVGEPSWVNFLLYNWRTIHTSKRIQVGMQSYPRVLDASGLSEEGESMLAFHLFMHRAIYGPQSIASLNMRRIQSFDHGTLKGEAALLRYEVLHAREDEVAEAAATELLTHFPGLDWRVSETQEGSGRLARLRRTRGAEQSFLTPPVFRPYKDDF